MSLLKRRRPTATHEPEDEHWDSDQHLSHDELPSVASMHPGPLDLLALDVARCICHGWSRGQLAAWEHAFKLAEERLGPIDGTGFVARLISLMRALMRERKAGLRYMPVRCSRICKDEEALMRSVQSAIGGDTYALKMAVADLTHTAQPENTYTLLAAQALGAFCQRYNLSAEAEGARPFRHTLN